MLVLPILTLLLVITSISGTDPNNDGGYSKELVVEEDLTMQDEVCGLVRLMSSALCVSVEEDNRKLILTSSCEEDRKIFCYNSTSRFIKLQGDEHNCVTKADKTLRLTPCSSEESTLSWVFTEDGEIKKEPTTNNKCWIQDNSDEGTNLVVGSCDKKFDFQLTRGPGPPLHLVSANQSSTSNRWNGQPERAIDGNFDSNYHSNSCTHTEKQTENWWKGILAHKSAVTKVDIHNRGDRCSERLDGAKVYVNDVLCGVVNYTANKKVYDIACRGAVGTSVKVALNNEYLTLCEVVVFGYNYKEQAINFSMEEIAIKILLKADDQGKKDYRFQVVLNFFSSGKDISMGQVRVQLKKLSSTVDQRITVVNWEEHESKRCSETWTELKKLHTGEADLILTSDVSGNVRIKLGEFEKTMICPAGFLNRSDRMVVQWIDLAHDGRNSSDNLFTVQYEVRTWVRPTPGKYKADRVVYCAHLTSFNLF